MKKTDDAPVIARRISEFLYEYAPQFLTNSEHTIKGYNDALTLYFQFLEENGVSPSSLDRHHLEKDWIEKWILWLKENRNNSPETCNNRLASIRRFLEYVASKDIRMEYLYQEAKHVRRQKCPKRKVTGLTREAVTAMLEAPDTTTAIGRRDLVFLTVLYATAARMDEVLSIKIGHLHLDAAKPHVNLYGKGEKLRTSYLLPRAVSLLRQYSSFQDTGSYDSAWVCAG
jgi:site-specific recombinase XerD